MFCHTDNKLFASQIYYYRDISNFSLQLVMANYDSWQISFLCDLFISLSRIYYILYVDYTFRNYSRMVMNATSPKCNTFYIISPLLQNDTIYATRQYVMQLFFNENLKC